MNKEEILAKSRQDNKNQDLVAAKADSTSASIAVIIALFYSLIVYMVQLTSGNGVNYSLFSLIALINAVINVYKSFSLRKKRYFLQAAVWVPVTIALVIATFSTMSA